MRRHLSLVGAFCALILGATLVWSQPVGVFSQGSFGPPPTCTTTWNPSDKNSNITLSNGNLTATSTAASGDQIVRATASHSSGKWYFELTPGSGTNQWSSGGSAVGYADASAPLTTTFLGGDTHSESAFDSDGLYFNAGRLLLWNSNYVSGDIMAIAVDLDNSKFWFKHNISGNWNNDVIGNQNPATNTGGVAFSVVGAVFPALDLSSLEINIAVANFGAVAFAGTAPVGFSCP